MIYFFGIFSLTVCGIIAGFDVRGRDFSYIKGEILYIGLKSESVSTVP